MRFPYLFFLFSFLLMLNIVYSQDSLVTDSLLADNFQNQHIQSVKNEEKSISAAQFDKIITLENGVYIVKVNQVTFTEVNFYYPLNNNLESINRKKVSQILYANGKIDLFIPLDADKSEPIKEDRLIVHSIENWEKVTVTDDKSAVANMIEIGPVKSFYIAEGVQVSNKYLEKNCQIILKRQAANLKADYVLIEKKTFNKRYGESPSIKIEATAFKSK